MINDIIINKSEVLLYMIRYRQYLSTLKTQSYLFMHICLAQTALDIIAAYGISLYF